MKVKLLSVNAVITTGIEMCIRDSFTAFHQGLHGESVLGAAIILDHHQILRDIHQTAGQITGVRGLQRGIRQTLTRTVGRDEVCLLYTSRCV